MRGEEVKNILEENGYQLNEVAGKLGISPQNFNNWLGVQDIKTGILEKIAGAIDKNIFYFIGNQSLKNQERKDFPDGAIKYYDIEASAGPIEMFDLAQGVKYKKIIIPNYGDCDIALNIWGDSMEPILKSGEIILCKEWKESFIEYGQIYLIVTRENHRMIKYIQPGSDNSIISCISENNKFSPIEINKNDIIKLYLVKGHIERSTI